MIGIDDWLAKNGLSIPSQAELVEAAVAGGLMLIALALGTAAGRTLGPPLSRWWHEHVAQAAEGLAPRWPALIRHGVAALVAAIVLAGHGWGPVAGLPIGLVLGMAAALATHQLLRGLGIARWASWTLEAIVFVALFSRAVGGLEPITQTLDAIGIGIGRRRLSLLGLLTVLVTAVVLVALVRLANKVATGSIGRARTLDATQKILGQKLAGIILLMDRSIKPGDVIAVGDSFGWVNKIGVRAVSVVTRDGKEHLIPNEDLMTREVENWSYSDRNVRVRITVRVPYDCDLARAQELMLKAATDSPRVLRSPKPTVWLTAYGNDGLEHEVLAWISDPESGVGNVRSDVLNRLWWLFKDEGIRIPYAQRDVYVRRWPEDGARSGTVPADPPGQAIGQPPASPSRPG